MNNEYIYKYTMSHELLDIYYSLLTINKENKKIDEIDKENIGVVLIIDTTTGQRRGPGL